MRTFLRLCLIVVAATVLTSAAFGSGREPDLRSASQRHGHVVLRFSLGSLTAGQVVVAKSPRRSGVGALTTRIELRANLPRHGPSGIRTWRSRRALPAGGYFVQVSGIDLAGVTDCLPRQVGCGQSWSNVRRVTVPG
jgi:hypothetical protein